MEVFNKIYSQVSSSVSSTVSQLSSVLPGNPVTREFDATSHIASAGPGLLWKIYKGYKRSTKQEAAIFVFEKRQLEKWNKTDREIILESLKRGVAQITKIRHPRILTIQHPLEESRESLAFATEPVFTSLGNLLGQTHNMPQPTNISDYKLFDLEIKYGLLQISEGLTFLHNDVKLLHKSITPENIIINQQGSWKIFGFDFCVHNTSPANAAPFYPFQELSPTIPFVAQPSLDFCAPECILMQTHSTASDMFSLGMVAYTLHSPDHQPLFPIKELHQVKNRVQQLKHISPQKLQCLPEALREYVKLMFNTTPEMRPDAHQFSKIPYFEDIGVKTLIYLDSLLQWDNIQRSQFYRGLPETLGKLPHRVKLQQVLPCLVRDLAQPAMIPFVLPSILDIAQECNQKEYTHHILSHLKPVMKLTEPVQILLIFLQRMELLLKLTPATDIQQHVLPMLYRGLDSDTPQIHEMCLSVLPTFAGLLDHAHVKNSVLPRIKRLCLSTSSLSVRVNCLLCIGQLLEHLDKWLVLDEIIPFLPQIPSREPAVLMGILGILKLALNHKKLGISKEVIATRILPFLIPLCIENGLTLSQFNALVVLIKQMFQMVETEHRTKLEQLNNVQEQQKVLESQLPTIIPASKPLEISNAFSGLGLDDIVTISLTLDDKQRMAKQEETVKLLQNQPVIQPTTAPQNKTLQQAKDLTSSLASLDSKMWNNMNLLSQSAKTTPPSSSTMPNNNNNNNPMPGLATVNSFGNNNVPLSSSMNFPPLMQNNQNLMQYSINQTSQHGLLNSNVTMGGLSNQLALPNSQGTFQNNSNSSWTGYSFNQFAKPNESNQNWNQPSQGTSMTTSKENNIRSKPLTNDEILDLLS